MQCVDYCKAVQLLWNGQIGGWGAWVTYQSSVRPAEWISDPHHIFDALHFLLVAVAVLHGAFLRFLQRTLQRLDSVSCRPETFLQFWKLTAKICIVTHQLSQTQHTQSETDEIIDLNIESSLVCRLVSRAQLSTILFNMFLASKNQLKTFNSRTILNDRNHQTILHEFSNQPHISLILK